jgi:hypothetical protein
MVLDTGFRRYDVMGTFFKGLSFKLTICAHFSRVESWRRAGAAFELFDARIYLEL